MHYVYMNRWARVFSRINISVATYTVTAHCLKQKQIPVGHANSELSSTHPTQLETMKDPRRLTRHLSHKPCDSSELLTDKHAMS